MNNPTAKQKTFAYALALGGAVLFSSKAIMVKLSYEFEIDKLSLLLLRMGFALPFYLFFAFNNPRHGQNEPLNGKDWGLLVALGVIGYYFASFLDFWGLQFINPSLERLILFVYPTITTILAAIYFRRKIGLKTWIPIGISYVGICIAFGGELLNKENPNLWLGALLVFGSALTFSFYLVGSEKLIPKFGSKRFTSYCMIISCLAVILHFFLAGTADISSFPAEVYWLGLGIAIFNTVLPSFMMSAAINIIGASSTSILSSVGPISVIILSYLILGEAITWYQVVGTLIVIAGVLLISRNK